MAEFKDDVRYTKEEIEKLIGERRKIIDTKFRDNVHYNKEEIEKLIEERRKIIDARFTMWSTRVKAIIRSGGYKRLGPAMIQPLGFLDDCNCCCGGGGPA